TTGRTRAWATSTTSTATTTARPARAFRADPDPCGAGPGSVPGLRPQVVQVGLHGLPGGQQAGGPRLLEAGCVPVLVREQRLEGTALAVRRRPLDPDRRVERVDAVLAARCVGRRAQVDDGRVVLEGAERVPQPLGDVDGAPVDVVEQDA